LPLTSGGVTPDSASLLEEPEPNVEGFSGPATGCEIRGGCYAGSGMEAALVASTTGVGFCTAVACPAWYVCEIDSPGLAR
jgi:hypothetical protein